MTDSPDPSRQPKKRHRKSWEKVRHDRRASLPQGPSSYRELVEWPIAVAKGIRESGKTEQDAEMLLRFRTNLLRGINLTLDYGGLCDREALMMSIQGFVSYYGCDYRFVPRTQNQKLVVVL